MATKSSSSGDMLRIEVFEQARGRKRLTDIIAKRGDRISSEMNGLLFLNGFVMETSFTSLSRFRLCCDGDSEGSVNV